MSATKQQLAIYLYGQRQGILEQTLTGKLQFTYDKDANQAISFAMPLREEAYGDIATEAFFGGLLPESELTKKIIGQRYGVSPNNNFALLKAIGHDCAGAISCHALDEEVGGDITIPLNARIISDEELYQHIKALPQQPLFMDVDGLRLSLAGVQDKAAVCMIENNIALAEQNCPTTHILKPGSLHFPNLAENEYFCLKVGKQLGLPIPSVELRQIKDISFLLIERYDRVVSAAGVQRIHQEDFCQALGMLSTRKYQNEGGPGFKQCFELLKNSIQPAIDRNLLASALVFNFLIGNMDAHGKNFSLLHPSPTIIKLAPFYDIVCTRIYEQLTANMAMKIGSKYSATAVLPRHWEQLCEEIQYGYPALKKLLIKQADLILHIAQEQRRSWLGEGRSPLFIDQLVDFLLNTIERSISRF